ncbi:MAG: 2-phosphosulfolactate phosphatase [Cytophagales bacterium]
MCSGQQVPSTHFLFLGADHVKPVGSLEECKVLKDDDYIIMAERMGKKVEGFDYGNSPTKFKEENIKGRKVAIATSNGSKAIIKSEGSKRTILCSFLNIESVINLIKKSESDVLLLCSGWLGKTNLEDTLCAGGIVAGLDNFEIESDTALMAKALHDNTDDILETMKLSSHAKRLSGYDNKVDIEFCSRVNTQPIVPILNGNQIVLS